MEKRYLVYMMNNKAYELDHEDLMKLEKNANKMLVRLKQVIIHPSSIVAIEVKTVKGTREVLQSKLGQPYLSDKLTVKPLTDLFTADVMKLRDKND